MNPYSFSELEPKPNVSTNFTTLVIKLIQPSTRRLKTYFKFYLDYLFLKITLLEEAFLFINLVFATLLSPPDVYSQIVILFVLTSFLEIIIFINLFLYKLQNEILNINKASY